MNAGSAALKLLIFGAMVAPLTGCEPTRSFELVTDGSVVYLDEMSDEEKDKARKTIVEGLQRGLEAYRLAPGDVIEILFHYNREPTNEEYRITVGDQISIEFLNEPDYNRTATVAPDGRIASPLTGTITAAGLTTKELADIVRTEYGNILRDPIVTLSLQEFRVPVDDIRDALGTSQAGRSKPFTVSPGGTIFLPLLPPVQAAGQTLEELKKMISQAYTEGGRSIQVSVLPSTIANDRVFVFGEVLKPGPVSSGMPQTVLMAIAGAGGVSLEGSMNAVRIFYIDEEQRPRVRSVNLLNVLDKLQLNEDMLVPDNSVIYVPPTKLAKAGRLVDQVVRDILLFNGFTAGFSAVYNIDNPGGRTIQGN